MKFGHEYQQHLSRDGFPDRWVSAAINYRQLKKCIKRVQKELAAIGLDADTLGQLLEQYGHTSSAAAKGEKVVEKVDGDGRPFQYLLEEEPSGSETATTFHPKLFFTIDEASGTPLDAFLSPATRKYLRKLAQAQKDDDGTADKDADLASLSTTSTNSAEDDVASCEKDISKLALTRSSSSRSVRLIEVPLTADSEFFSLLQSELSGLAELQQEEQDKLASMVKSLTIAFVKFTQTKRRHSKTDMDQWRAIFELYVQSRIFFSNTEQDRGAHNAAKAAENLEEFRTKLQSQQQMTKFRRKESAEALKTFLEINVELLLCLRFQEINHTAMTKILKKFDKRTALGVKSAFPKTIQYPILPDEVAKGVCAQLSSELLSMVPQLDDYLCPVCTSIAYRPVRLKCQHVFCIRCIIVLQRAKERHCPMCRSEVLMIADSDNIDWALMNLMKKYFPNESKEKQRENERAITMDLYGGDPTVDCTVM